MSYKNYLMYAACLFQALAVAGQDSTRWSLQECIDYAIAHNIQLKQNKITEEQGAADLLQKKAELFPSLSFSTTQAIDYRPLQKSETSIVANGIANSSSNKLTENGNLWPQRLVDRMGRRSQPQKHQGAKATKPNLGLGHTDHCQQHPGTNSPVVRANPLLQRRLRRKQSHGRNGEKPVWTRKGDV